MPHSLDSTDRQIVKLLQRDGRMSNVEIARRTELSEATVRKRLERLLSDDVMRIVAIPEPSRVGLPMVTFLAFDVELGGIDQVADRLGRAPEVRSIHYTSGEGNLIVEAWFPSSHELLRFLTQYVASIPGIKRTSTSHVLRTVKDGSRWVLPSVTPSRILLVDDDPDFVEITRLALAAEGFEVSAASSGEEALASMRVLRPDLVVLDMMMRGILDGWQTVKTMRSDGDLRTVPILMVSSITGSDFAGLLPREQELPVDNFLTKPVELSVLVAEVRRLLRSKE
jgi:Lrp/AsnC family transcriptional regulator for asnA, asnC and gidA